MNSVSMDKTSFNLWLNNTAEQCMQSIAVYYHLSLIFLMPLLVSLLILYLVSGNESEFGELALQSLIHLVIKIRKICT